MATVRPFRGIVYDHARVDLGRVTCPPYDVISDADRLMLYDRDPYNVVRIVAGATEPDDSDGDDRYTRAAGFFRSWLWEGVLREDDREAIFVYRQAFTDPAGRLRRVSGLLATISLDDRILAHERTMPGPKADRLALMRAVPANLSPIYALYREPAASVSQELESFASPHPTAEFADDEGTRHSVWAVHDAAFHERVAKALRPSPIYIADGHHRFDTAKTYRAEQGRTGPWDDVMAFLVDAGAQPVSILPYHRIVRRCDAEVLSTLADGFDIEPLGEVEDPQLAALELWSDRRPGVFLLFEGRFAYQLAARRVPPDEIPAATLSRLALEPLGATDAERDLSFTPSARLVAEEVAARRAVCGFCLQPVGVDRIWTLAASGATMPEKSTYFHPKPRDGIVMRPLS